MESVTRDLKGARPRIAGLGYGVATDEDFERTPLHPEESGLMEGMRPGRRREFWMGRAAAHRALSELGTVDGPVLSVDRRPIFPSGFVGSLSHSCGAAVAIAAPKARFAALGIDIELNPMPAAAAHLVLAPEECELARRGEYSCAEAFSAKEAGFKALSALPVSGPLVLRLLALDRITGGFKVRLPLRRDIPAYVFTRSLGKGWLAWTAIRATIWNGNARASR